MNLSCPHGIREQHHRLGHCLQDREDPDRPSTSGWRTLQGLWKSRISQEQTSQEQIPKFSNNTSLKKKKKIVDWFSKALNEIPTQDEGRLWDSAGEIWPCLSSTGTSQDVSCSPTGSQWSRVVPAQCWWPWCPFHNIPSAALRCHPLGRAVIKGWLRRALVFLNSLSRRRTPHNERVSAGHELETDFVVLGKVMFTNHSLGVPDGCGRVGGWGGRSPQHHPKWP